MLVEPEQKWRVQKGDSTAAVVVNKDGTRCFDLEYWCLGTRLGHYLFGDELKEHDLTLGGRHVFSPSVLDDADDSDFFNC
jgi:hypothetical protein